MPCIARRDCAGNSSHLPLPVHQQHKLDHRTCVQLELKSVKVSRARGGRPRCRRHLSRITPPQLWREGGAGSPDPTADILFHFFFTGSRAASNEAAQAIRGVVSTAPSTPKTQPSTPDFACEDNLEMATMATYIATAFPVIGLASFWASGVWKRANDSENWFKYPERRSNYPKVPRTGNPKAKTSPVPLNLWEYK